MNKTKDFTGGHAPRRKIGSRDWDAKDGSAAGFEGESFNTNFLPMFII